MDPGLRWMYAGFNFLVFAVKFEIEFTNFFLWCGLYLPRQHSPHYVIASLPYWAVEHLITLSAKIGFIFTDLFSCWRHYPGPWECEGPSMEPLYSEYCKREMTGVRRGVIHRVKEHLAGVLINVSSCSLLLIEKRDNTSLY